MRTRKLLLLLLVPTLLFADHCSCYRILGIYPFVGKSHYIMMNQLFKGMARKGHQVDVITPFPQTENVPNYTQIFQFPDKTAKIIGNLNYDIIKGFSRTGNLSSVLDIGYKLCEYMGMPEFLNLARHPPKDPPYDVVITQVFNSNCFMVLGHLWNVPVVLVSTSALYPHVHDMIGNPENVAISPNNFSPVPPGTGGLWWRLYNAYFFYTVKSAFVFHSRNQNELLQRYFGPRVPDIRQLERSASLLLVNTYFPVNGVKPTTTGLVEVGGLHIQNDGPEMTDDLKRWLDESKDGVVYFSLGSILRIEMFPEETVAVIFDSLGRLSPTRVLMRVANPESLSVKLPPNFRTLPWMPQEKILQHPSVRVFVTHGGLLGTQESVFYGVPMLCLPVLADQWTNTQNYVQKKVAVSADIMSLTRETRETFDGAINEVLGNPVYRDNVRELSRLFRDRPLSAMDTTAFWIEFVVRNGKDVLRSPAMDLTWWQLDLLDVLAVTTAGLSLILFVAVFTIKTLLRCLLGKSRTEKSVSKRKKE